MVSTVYNQKLKKLIRWRKWLMILGTLFMLLPVSSWETTKTRNGEIVYRHYWLMSRDTPELAVLSGSLAVCCWASLFLLKRLTVKTGVS